MQVIKDRLQSVCLACLVSFMLFYSAYFRLFLDIFSLYRYIDIPRHASWFFPEVDAPRRAAFLSF